MRLHAATAHDLGLGRTNNEDSWYAGQRLVAVADGVGGQPAGEVASDLVVEALKPLDADTGGDSLAALTEAVLAANEAVRDAAGSDPDHDGMATTVTALLLTGEELALVHVGDSRAYRLRDGELEQLSTDHTYVQMLVDRGAITREEAWHHPQRSVVTRVVPADPLRPQAERLTPRAGDRYLLCSDGLSDVVSDEAIAEALTSHDDPQAGADQLVKLALQGGAPDNVTVIVADLDAESVGG